MTNWSHEMQKNFGGRNVRMVINGEPTDCHVVTCEDTGIVARLDGEEKFFEYSAISSIVDNERFGHRALSKGHTELPDIVLQQMARTPSKDDVLPLVREVQRLRQELDSIHSTQR